MCGNFYGSNIVRRSNDNEGMKIFEERLRFYKLTPKEYDRKCSKYFRNLHIRDNAKGLFINDVKIVVNRLENILVGITKVGLYDTSCPILLLIISNNNLLHVICEQPPQRRHTREIKF